MFFFEPYTPGEITFYGLLFGGYKLRKKMRKWDEEYKEGQRRKRFDRWVAQLKITCQADYERMNKLLFNAYMKGQISFDDWKQKSDAVLELYRKLESKD